MRSRSELQRLEGHKLATRDHELLQTIQDETVVVLTLNVQSLEAHVADLTSDTVLMKATILCLTETHVGNDTTVEIEGYQCLAQCKPYLHIYMGPYT